MKKSKFTEEQIAFALKQAEGGTLVSEIMRRLGVTEAIFYRWKQKYGGLLPSEVQKMRQPEEENNRLEIGSRSDFGQANVTGCYLKKVVKPVLRGERSNTSFCL